MRIPMPQAVYGLCDVLPALTRDGKALSPKYVPKTILCPSALKVVELHHPCRDQWISQFSVLRPEVGVTFLATLTQHSPAVYKDMSN